MYIIYFASVSTDSCYTLLNLLLGRTWSKYDFFLIKCYQFIYLGLKRSAIDLGRNLAYCATRVCDFLYITSTLYNLLISRYCSQPVVCPNFYSVSRPVHVKDAYKIATRSMIRGKRK